MGETGTSRSLGNLDPTAQEFKPRNQMTLFAPTQIYSPYTLPYPSPELQLMPFSDGGVGYLQFPYVTPAVGSPPVSPVSVTPTRTLLLSSVPADVSEETVRREMEAFGEVRSVRMERAGDGIVAVSFYDLRHAQACLTEVREQHMQQQSRLRKHFIDSMFAQNLGSPAENLPAPVPPPARGLIAGRAAWAQFMIPVTSSTSDGHNQGTLVIFNLDSRVSTSNLREIFETFGSIKELRETPLKRHQRFVEFFDIRDAARALREMNGKQVHGRRLVIQFSRPGGHGGRFFAGVDSTTPSSTSSTASPRCPPAVPREPSKKSSSSNVSPRSRLSQTQHPTKKSSVGVNKRSSNGGAVEASMASLCLAGSVCGIEDSDGVPRRNPKKSPNRSSTAKQQQQAQRYRPWKGRHKNFDSHFLIDEDAVADSSSGDSRTTVMIKNIPNKYSQQLLMNMLDNHCNNCNEQILAGENQPLSSYDFLYLPIDFNNKCNVGYGFVNMTSPQATRRLYKAFHLKSWEIFNSTKICQVTYARIQGLEALKEHFKNSKFLCATEAYLPVMFSPPRDGRQLTVPRPVVAHDRLIGDDSKASDDEDGDEEDMTTDGPHRLSSGDCVCDCDDDDDVEDYDGRDRSPNDGNSG